MLSNFSDSFTREGSQLLTAKLHVWAYNDADAWNKAQVNLQTLAWFHGLDVPVESHRITLVYPGYYRVEVSTDGSLQTEYEHQRDYPLTD